MWNLLVITSVFGFCVLVQAGTPISTRKSNYGPLEAPNCGTIKSRSRRIIGGTNAKLGAFPWMATLRRNIRAAPSLDEICAGSIISKRHVLTSGNCAFFMRIDNEVRLGDLSLSSSTHDGASPINVRVEEIFIHPNYSFDYFSQKSENDIAVLRLERDLQFTDLIKPICLPSSQDVPEINYEGTIATIAGWGYDGSMAAKLGWLQTAQVKVISTLLCKKKYEYSESYFLQNTILCAGDPSDDEKPSMGDAGLPLMIEQDGSYYIIGILSPKDAMDADERSPFAYTKVSSYLEWIISKLH